MRAVNRHVVVEQRAQQPVVGAGPRMPGIPEQAVMHQQEVGAGLHSEPDRGEAGVHSGGESADAATVLSLQPVPGAVPVGKLAGAQEAVAGADHRRQRTFSMERRNQMLRGEGSAICRREDFACRLLNSAVPSSYSPAPSGATMSNHSDDARPWDLAAARSLYNIDRWARGISTSTRRGTWWRSRCRRRARRWTSPTSPRRRADGACASRC